LAYKSQWFVLHALSGQENKVCKNMAARMPLEEVEEYIQQVLVPSEKVSEVKGGTKRELNRKFFPGYVLVEMCMYDDANNLNEKAWHFVLNTPGVIGFVGGERDQPIPLPQKEVDLILNQIEEKQDQVIPKIDFDSGETIRINDGPFQNFNGVIDEIDPERGKLKVTVSIFGRDTPVELEYWQVEKVS